MSTPTLSSTTPADAAPARPDQPLLPMAILGTGEALPRRVVTTAEVAARCGLPADEAEQRSGVLTRHWISPDEDPLDLGVAAARSALADAGLTIADIDCVLNASGTPMQAIPDGGALLAAELGMAPTKSAYSVHGTCLSFLFALREAALLIAHGSARHVLIVSTEAGSRGLNFAQPESALLIGDAAAAVVVGPAQRPGQGLVRSSFITVTSGVEDARIRGFGTRIPIEEASERLTDFKFDMQGIRLLASAIRAFPKFLEDFEPGLSSGLGDTIAAGIPLTLHRARIQPGERLLLVGSGAGTHFGALLVQN
ncbi:ketoacyl-ACP synthase III [Propioniciclava sinopodophylli]|uniref:Ketoacyl-ACP synthase III n=1 Tax=Propioniciclava sinopodophylli TaxID=1837344 RepID=A0A4Q9KFH1_9ACTN|nr:ketoacyl-ACP synthase III [Propioniciclava sinopodophylli]TBT85064.1 ketoacyl-ACP synthase III [Propioniciclava sinopodophylli]